MDCARTDEIRGEGKVNKQIADCLKISEWTVSTYHRRIFAKLGVDSRAAMVFKCSNSIQQKNNKSS
jgi:DNA-binding CsgD family transcriptional regulator